MAETNSNVFLIQFSVISENPENRRLAYLNKFVKDGLGEHITVLESIILPNNRRNASMMLVEADTKESIEKKLKECGEAYKFKVEPVDSYSVMDAQLEPNFCLFTSKVQENPISPKANPTLWPEVKVKTMIRFGASGSYSNIVLVHASGNMAVKAFSQNKFPKQIPYVDPIMDVPNFLEKIKNPSPVTIPSPSEKVQPKNTKDCKIVNVGRDTSFYNQGNRLYDIYKELKQIPPKQTIQVANKTYAWKSLIGEYEVENTWYYQGFPGHEFSKTPTTNPLPDMVIPYISGGEIHVDVSRNQIEIITDASKWLNKLLANHECKSGWPEDHYVGEELKAYNYILSQLPGETPPKKGTVKPGLIEAITYVTNPDYTSTVFGMVKSHLLKETTYFQYAKDWFATNGVISVLNGQLTTVSTDKLLSAAALMSIPEDTTIFMVMDIIMNLFTGIIGAIKGIGPIISGILKTGIAGAKLGGKETNNINGVVSEMADKLAGFLIEINKVTSDHYQVITSNYCNLKEFTTGVVTEIISLEKVGVTETASLEEEQGPKVATSYLEAASKAWEIIFYQALFTVKHTPFSTFYVSDVLPKNTWDPANGKYTYTFAFNCTYLNSSNKEIVGYLVIESYTDAPEIVKKTLFGADSKLQVDPMEFFVGFNGWTTPIPVNHLTSIVSIG